MKKFLIFLIFLSITLYFLYFQQGLWLVQDLFYWPRNLEDVKNTFQLSSVFNIFNRYEYFHGIDHGEFSAIRIFYLFFSTIINLLFGTELGQIIYIGTGIIFAFFGVYKFLQLFTNNKNSIFYISLFYTFNPLLFSLLNQSYIHVYGAIPLFLYSFIKFFGNDKKLFKYIFINIFSALIIISYLRFIQITFILGIIIFVYFFTYKKIHISIKKILIFIFLYFLSFLPTIYLVFYKFFSGDNFAHTNFVNNFKNYIPNGSPLEFINFFKTINIDLKYPYFYIIFSFIIIFFAFYFFIQKRFIQKNKLAVILFITGLFLYTLPIFSQNIYNFFLKFLPFLQNVPYYAYYIIIFGLIIFLVNNIDFSKKISKFLFLFIVFFNVLPFMFDNIYLKKIDINSKIPNEYKEKFNVYNKEKMFLSTLYLYDKCWYAEFSKDYPTCYNYGYDFSNIFLNNPRILNKNALNITKYFYNGEFPININSLKNIYNLKYVIKPKDIIINSEQGPYLENKKFDFINKFSLDKLNLFFESKSFDIYGLKDNEIYDYFIYSPSKVIFYENFEELMKDNEEENYSNLLFLDKKNIYINKEIEKVNIFYKSSSFDFSKYFLKIDRKNLDKDFIINLNQTFSKSWKLKWITKEDFEEIKCENDFKEFKTTNNKYCNYKAKILDLNDTKYLYKEKIPEAQHFEGNFIGNTWFIKPENIPKYIKNKDELYAIIIYEKQIWYNWTLLISGFTFIILLSYLGFDFYRNRKNFKNK